MPSHTPIILLLAFAEGGALLSYQLVCARLLSPWFGTSVEVWSSVLGMTLAGLAVGYAWGASMAVHANPARRITLLLTSASIFLISLPWWSSFLQNLLGAMPLRAGSLLSCLILISPLMMLLGTFSPLSIALLERAGYPAHRAAGIVFGTSTVGGVAYALAIALWIAPTYGLAFSCRTLGLLLLAAVLFFASRLSKKQTSATRPNKT
jgi:hypothetical protein